MSAREHSIEIRHAHLFCGLGGGARGFNRGSARHGNLVARFRCTGGIDHAPGPLADFARLAGVPGTLLDLFDEAQFRAFYDRAPPKGWRPAEPIDIRKANGGESPHIWFLSAPCKGFSGLLAESASKSEKYQALNRLTVRGVWLALEAYKDDPVDVILFENVPRIQTRGRHLLDQISALMRAYGYAWAETTHDCGEIGGLAQSRKRFLGIARHTAKVPAFVYEPPQRGLRGVGEVLERLPMPDETSTGMHRMPALNWRTWVRLAFVEAGSDWRSLNRLRVEDGMLADFGIAREAEYHGGCLGVTPWDEPSGTITSRSAATTGRFAVADPRAEHRERSSTLGVRDWKQNIGVVAGEAYPTNGAFAVADPRVDGHAKSVQLGVRQWDQPAPVITSKMIAGGGPNSVADPRIHDRTPFNHCYRIVEWHRPAKTVSAARGALQAVSDPRAPERANYKVTKYRVTGFDEATGAVIAASSTGNGAFAVADPRHQMVRETRAAFDGGGHYGVLRWASYSGAIASAAMHDNGRWSVADPRIAHGGAEAQRGECVRGSDDSQRFDAKNHPGNQSGPLCGSAPPRESLPAVNDRLVCMIRALDGTWHRPITTLEMAALQSLFDPDDFAEFDLHGKSDSAWREGIGNAVPSDAATAIASVIGRTLLAVWSGETFMLSSEPIWVKPLAIALSVDTGAAP